MDPKKTPSGPEKRDNAPLQANNAPLLSNEKEEIIARLKNVDINGDGIADGPAEKKMLDWTINEIRKTCGNLPAEKLRLLIERISKVMMERSVQQSRIQQEVARESSALKQEVDVAQEKKSPSKATFTDRLFKIAQDHTDIRLRSKGLIDDI